MQPDVWELEVGSSVRGVGVNTPTILDVSFSFTVRATDGGARLGQFETPHGTVHTPAFMPVGTQGAVKATLFRDVEELGAEIVLGNTYHLYLRPGDELIARRGGLHRFIGWSRPI